MDIKLRGTLAAPRRRQRGSAVVEYTIITLLVVVVLIADTNVIAMVIDAVKQLYGAFTFALSITTP